MDGAAAQRALIALVQVLSLSVWFSASAVVPAVRVEWAVTATAAVWLTASVQLGFVVGSVSSAALNLPDRLRPSPMMAVCALAAACCTELFALAAGELAGGIALRFATGVCLAGVYPVGLKLTASWSEPARRGRAFGLLIGALTLGSALPHLIGGLGDLRWRTVMTGAALIGASGALIAATLVRTGPLLAPSARPYPRYALTMFTERGPRLVNLGYFGHMWELYALWTWLPSYLIASNTFRDTETHIPVGVAAFTGIGIAGVAGCMIGGWAADRFGRSAAAVSALAVSGMCCLLSPAVFGTDPAGVLAFTAVWGAAVIADSGVFSTSLSEVADRRYVGTALTAQTAIGFLLTVVTIQLVPVVAAAVGWRWAFLILVPGPAAGIIAMRIFGANTARALH